MPTVSRSLEQSLRRALRQRAAPRIRDAGAPREAPPQRPMADRLGLWRAAALQSLDGYYAYCCRWRDYRQDRARIFGRSAIFGERIPFLSWRVPGLSGNSPLLNAHLAIMSGQILRSPAIGTIVRHKIGGRAHRADQSRRLQLVR